MTSTPAVLDWRSMRRRKIDRRIVKAHTRAAELVQTLERPKTGVLGQVLGLGGVAGQAQRRPIEVVEVHEYVSLESANPVAGGLLP
jgi:hypothetical protein